MRWVITAVRTDSVYTSTVVASTAEQAFEKTGTKDGRGYGLEVDQPYIVAPAEVGPSEGQRSPHARILKFVAEPKIVRVTGETL